MYINIFRNVYEVGTRMQDVDNLIKQDFLLMLNERVGALESQIHEVVGAVNSLKNELHPLLNQLQYDAMCIWINTGSIWQEQHLDTIVSSLKTAVVHDGHVRIVEAIVSPGYTCNVLVKFDRPYFEKVLDCMRNHIALALPDPWTLSAMDSQPMTETTWRVKYAQLHANSRPMQTVTFDS